MLQLVEQTFYFLLILIDLGFHWKFLLLRLLNFSLSQRKLALFVVTFLLKVFAFFFQARLSGLKIRFKLVDFALELFFYFYDVELAAFVNKFILKSFVFSDGKGKRLALCQKISQEIFELAFQISLAFRQQLRFSLQGVVVLA